MKTASDSRGSSAIDLPTVAAVAVVAYALTNLLHEGLGHGGACLLVGARPRELNAIFFRCDSATVGMGARRLVSAGGSVVDLLAAAAAYAALRLGRPRPGPTHYFLWLLFTINLLMPFGYLAFSGIGGFGDWAVVVDGLRPAWLFRAMLTLTGVALYFILTPKLIMPALNVYLGRDPKLRAARARRLSLFPYLVGGTTLVLAGLFNAESWTLIFLSAAAASFGGTSLLAWYPGNADTAFRAAAPEDPAPLRRSVPWIVLGLLAFGVFVAVFGPGLRL